MREEILKLFGAGIVWTVFAGLYVWLMFATPEPVPNIPWALYVFSLIGDFGYGSVLLISPFFILEKFDVSTESSHLDRNPIEH